MVRAVRLLAAVRHALGVGQTRWREARRAAAVRLLRRRLSASDWTVVDLWPEIDPGVFDQADVVSFDVFDTLLMRPVRAPSSVFDLTARAALDDGIDLGSDWPARRRRAGAQRSGAGRDLELPAIHALATDLHDHALLTAELELRVERSLLRPTARGRRLYDLAVANGKPIAVVSDMYLSKAQLTGLLELHGFAAPDLLVISAVDRTAKADGTSFALVRERFPGARVVHVGDNVRVDVESARDAGLSAVELRRPDIGGRLALPVGPLERPARPGQPGQPRLEDSLREGLTDLWLERRERPPSEHEQFGFTLVGPALAGLAIFVERTARDRVDRLLFLSREGRLLMTAYQALAGPDSVPSCYLRVSRRALGPAALQAPFSELDYAFLTTAPRPLTPLQYLQNTLPGADRERVEAVLARHHIHAGRSYTRQLANPLLRPLFDAFAADIARATSQAGAAALAYLHRQIPPDERCAVVDVGWRGTMQAMLAQLMDRPVDGIYLALAPDAHPAPPSRAFAWLDARSAGAGAHAAATALSHTRLLEPIFTDPDERSLHSIEEHEGEISFRFQPAEVATSTAADVRAIHHGALDFVRLYGETRDTVPTDLPSVQEALDDAAMHEGAGALLRAVDTPTRRQRRVLRGLVFRDHGFTPDAPADTRSQL